PMLVISPTTSSGMNAAKIPVNTKKSTLDLYGVLNLRCTSEKIFGTRPSRLMEKNTRDWPSSITRITDEKPARIATVTDFDSHSNPVMYFVMANATEASRPAVRKSWTVATPLSTSENSTYKMAQMTNDPRIPIGISRLGWRTACAAVETASTPTYAKNTTPAAPRL